MKIGRYFFSISIFIGLVLSLELISWYRLPEDEQKTFLFFTKESGQEVFGWKAYRVDPLLGWTFSSEASNSKFQPVNGVVKLSSYRKEQQDTLKILITGGSTSDLIYAPKCWPLYLFEGLREQYSVEIYVAAVGGYNSGQELLKTLDLLVNQDLDLHISYSGANELFPIHLRYVSEYEETVFDQMINGVSPVLPNTVTYLRDLLRIDPLQITSGGESSDPARFWIHNIRAMNSLSNEFNYEFIGILQPVLGIGPHPFDSLQITQNSTIFMVEGFRKYYHTLQQEASKLDFVTDFTHIFENDSVSPFIDDCHIITEFQVILADRIHSLLKEKFLHKLPQKLESTETIE